MGYFEYSSQIVHCKSPRFLPAPIAVSSVGRTYGNFICYLFFSTFGSYLRERSKVPYLTKLHST